MIKVEVSGNVGAEVREYGGHTFFSVASNKLNKKEGTKVTTWVDIAVFSNSNLDVSEIAKGVYVTVKGKGQLETFKEKTKLKVVADEITVGFPVGRATGRQEDDSIPF